MRPSIALLVALAGGAAGSTGVGVAVTPGEGTMHHRHPASEGTLAPPSPAIAPAWLPAAAGVWTRNQETRRIDPAAIFDYMDGAGEMYLAYRFDHLDVFEYHAAAEGDILVEIYRMAGPDDAFGLLSVDWGGDAVAFAAAAPAAAGAAEWPRALYGAGLLRLRAGAVYARVMATRETPASRDAVLALGRTIAAAHAPAAPPRLVLAVPPQVAAGLRLRRDSVCFLRSHLVLNSAYFLSQRNILDLGSDVGAVTASYETPASARGVGRPRVVLVRYPDARRARTALAHFRQAYLPETTEKAGAVEVIARIEDGWAAAGRRGPAVAVALECPTRETATGLLQAGLHALETMEVGHE